MGRFQFPHARSPGQPSPSRRWHPACRRCLLKGCERWFLPRRPQARYCSPACQDAARRWRCWMARQRYRATPHGRQRRRDQARRARHRQQQRSSTPDPDHSTAHDALAPPAGPAEPPLLTDAPSHVPDSTVGQRPGDSLEKIPGLPCHRPGCYDLFLPTPRSPDQKFCSTSCRQALRRVRQREARLRQRRRRGSRSLGRSHRGPPRPRPIMSSRLEDVGPPP